NVASKVEHVRGIVAQRFPDAAFQFTFVGAPQLLQLAESSAPTTFELNVAETPISTENVAYVCLVRLEEFNRLISNADGTLRTVLFDANVRDYEGSVEVNQAIQETLENGKEEDFWWLNNGVTIVAAQVSLAGKTLRMENPQIVNGLQT